MPYNPAMYFPQTYQPQMYQPLQNMQQAVFQNGNNQSMTPPTIHAEIVQVDNEDAVDRFPLAAGASQMFMTRDDAHIIIKTMYQNGQYNKDCFDKRPPAPVEPPFDPAAYVTKEEFESRIAAITAPAKKKEGNKE